jgi:hypothetical protein
VLNRKWVDKDETRKGPGDDEPLTDEDDVERAEHFEKQYNFRYEEEYVYGASSGAGLFAFGASSCAVFFPFRISSSAS